MDREIKKILGDAEKMAEVLHNSGDMDDKGYDYIVFHLALIQDMMLHADRKYDEKHLGLHE